MLRTHGDVSAAAALAILAACVLSCAHTNSFVVTDVTRDVIRAQLPAGGADVDVYWPAAAARAPMVIVAHGFSRNRHNMSGWGRHLATEGIVAVVPDLPSRSDHARNGRFLSELRAHLLGDESWKQRVDPARVGLLGFSAGGLSSLLSAAHSPGVAIWVGLDPVDRDGLGAKAAALLQARAVILTAEPSSCNARATPEALLPPCLGTTISKSPGRSMSTPSGPPAGWPNWFAVVQPTRNELSSRLEPRRP